MLFCKLSVIRSCRCLPQLNLGLLKIQLDPACSPMYDVLQSHGLTANSLCIRTKQPCIVSNSVVFKDPASTCWRRDGLDGCCRQGWPAVFCDTQKRLALRKLLSCCLLLLRLSYRSCYEKISLERNEAPTPHPLFVLRSCKPVRSHCRRLRV